MKFIDLFAGLGGFHKALHELGHECVYASELKVILRNTYFENWGIIPAGDIKDIVSKKIESIPPHDILCAGFPCQPFSKAGKQLGMNDKTSGTLFDDIVKILEYHKPKYFILENVPFIARHDNEITWNYMESEFARIEYHVKHEYYSPHEFGVPQHRKRIFIVGSLENLSHFTFDDINRQKTSLINLNEFLDDVPTEQSKKLSDSSLSCLNLWQEFLDKIPKEVSIPGFPIWSMEFGATYPYLDAIPSKLSAEELGHYKGNFGIDLRGLSKKQQLLNLPSYARTTKKFPSWKKRYIRENRRFYDENKEFICDVVKKISSYQSQSWQKLEWNVGENERDIFKYILQFRASGIRIKKADIFPSLVLPSTQVPIIGWQKRYITKNEGLKLQSLEGLQLPDVDNAAFQALGNAVNAKIVKLIAYHLIREQRFEYNTNKKLTSDKSLKKNENLTAMATL